ncbi:MAG: hypothetical protein PVI99_08175 [Anaerolineales bacterium]|jgi:hypothetical protein
MLQNPKRLIIIGFFLVLVGAVVPWLMILGFLKSTLFLNFLTYGASVSGLILGIIGAAMLGSIRKR